MNVESHRQRSRARAVLWVLAAVILAGWVWRAVALPLHAAEAPAPAPRQLQVRGHASVSLTPDTATVHLGVLTRAESAQEAMAHSARAARRILEAVGRLGIGQEHLRTRGVQLSPVVRRDEKTGEGRLSGYEARYDLEVVVRDLDRVGPLVDAAVRAGANQVHSIRFTVHDAEAARQQALQQAMADGLRQARILADAAGLTLGPLQTVDEVRVQGPPEAPVPVSLVAREAAALPVVPGELRLEASVRLTFEIR